MGHTMVVAVHPDQLSLLDALVAEQQSTELRWQAAAEQRAGLLGLRGPELRAARARIRSDRDRLRQAGTHRVTRWHALAPALRTELELRRLLRDWDPIPEDAQQGGQLPGGTGPHSGTGLTGRLCLTLPDTAALPLQRGVYWSNQPHIQALQEWGDQWGTDTASRLTAPPEALAERAQTAARITTTGQIIRQALHHTVNNR